MIDLDNVSIYVFNYFQETKTMIHYLFILIHIAFGAASVFMGPPPLRRSDLYGVGHLNATSVDASYNSGYAAAKHAEAVNRSLAISGSSSQANAALAYNHSVNKSLQAEMNASAYNAGMKAANRTTNAAILI